MYFLSPQSLVETLWFTWPQQIKLFFINKALFSEQNHVVRALIFFWRKILIGDWVTVCWSIMIYLTPTKTLFFIIIESSLKSLFTLTKPYCSSWCNPIESLIKQNIIVFEKSWLMIGLLSVETLWFTGPQLTNHFLLILNQVYRLCGI